MHTRNKICFVSAVNMPLLYAYEYEHEGKESVQGLLLILDALTQNDVNEYTQSYARVYCAL